MNDMNRQALYASFLNIYNSCAETFVGNLTEMLLGKDPWKAREGKEVQMNKLKKIWGDLDLLELGYKDEDSYHEGLVSIQRQLLLV